MLKNEQHVQGGGMTMGSTSSPPTEQQYLSSYLLQTNSFFTPHNNASIPASLITNKISATVLRRHVTANAQQIFYDPAIHFKSVFQNDTGLSTSFYVRSKNQRCIRVNTE